MCRTECILCKYFCNYYSLASNNKKCKNQLFWPSASIEWKYFVHMFTYTKIKRMCFIFDFSQNLYYFINIDVSPRSVLNSLNVYHLPAWLFMHQTSEKNDIELNEKKVELKAVFRVRTVEVINYFVFILSYHRSQVF